MVKFTPTQIRSIMGNKHNIRNMSVIAHVDHGKSTLSDSLVMKSGIISERDAGEKRYMDGREDEQQRGITIKSTSITLYHELTETENCPPTSVGRSFLINLIDSPGHVDFSSEVTAALRVTDGALVVVDCVGGVCVQTETVLRQALTERVRPVLVINKVDRMIMELRRDPEEAYMNFVRAVENINVIVSNYQDSALGEVAIYPELGNVAFASALQGWGFTLQNFANMYGSKFKLEPAKLMKRLWGDNYYDPSDKKWKKTNQGSDGKTLSRSFVQFVFEPITKLFLAIAEKKKDTYDKMIDRLGIELKGDEKKLEEKELMKAVMHKWLPCEETLLRMIIMFLPSPAAAQVYRCETLYTGPQDSAIAKSIRECDENGPLIMYVSKMVPTSDKGRFYAFGRVYSGKVAAGQKVRVLEPGYHPDKPNVDSHDKSIQRVVIMMGRTVDAIPDCPCGNCIGLTGVDQAIAKSGTITDSADAYIIKDMKFSVSAVVQIAVEPKFPADLPKLVEGLKRLAKSDQLCQTFSSPSGEHIIAGAGELHLEICRNDLVNEYCNCELIFSKPVVSFCESVTEESEKICLAKSANNQNRLQMVAKPLGEGLAEDIENGDCTSKDDVKTRGKFLIDKYGWDQTETKKIWAFGPEGSGPNMFVDSTKSVQFLHEIKDSVVSGFQQATLEGVLCQEVLRGVRFHLIDVHLHPDSIHRGGGQITPAARNCMYASEYLAKPCILEPIYLVDIQAPQSCLGGISSCLNKRRGKIESQENRSGTPLTHVEAFLPVMESFGFTEDLRAQTGGQAFPQCTFSHFEILYGNPFDPTTKSGAVVEEVRKRKGLGAIPGVDRYLDKL